MGQIKKGMMIIITKAKERLWKMQKLVNDNQAPQGFSRHQHTLGKDNQGFVKNARHPRCDRRWLGNGERGGYKESTKRAVKEGTDVERWRKSQCQLIKQLSWCITYPNGSLVWQNWRSRLEHWRVCRPHSAACIYMSSDECLQCLSELRYEAECLIGPYGDLPFQSTWTMSRHTHTVGTVKKFSSRRG